MGQAGTDVPSSPPPLLPGQNGLYQFRSPQPPPMAFFDAAETAPLWDSGPLCPMGVLSSWQYLML